MQHKQILLLIVILIGIITIPQLLRNVRNNKDIFLSSQNKESNDVIYTFDLSYTNNLNPNDAYEHVHLIAAIAGLVNRNGAKFYYFYQDHDQNWLDYLKTQTNFLNGKTYQNILYINDVVKTFEQYYPQGVVLYDPQVWATSIIASTIAGVYNVLPICQRSQSENDPSLYQMLVESKELPVFMSLVNKFNGSVTGSKKNDAYHWAIDNLMDKVNPTKMGYYLDYYWTTNPKKDYNMFTVSNQDYFIANKAFFFDLYFWDDETPNDDPGQPLGTDYQTALKMMQRIYNEDNQGSQMIHIGGFTPWNFKYLSDKHGGVNNEWRTVQILTGFNAYLDADACCIGAMSNAAFYQHYPLQERYVQKSQVWQQKQFIDAGYLDNFGQVSKNLYIHLYVGDYDSAAWLYSSFIQFYNNPDRGKIPLGWAVNPNLRLRFPFIFEYLYKTQTDNDYFTTGDSGAGYVTPTQVTGPRISGLPNGVKVWQNHNMIYYNQFNLKFTGFLIQGLDGKMTDEAEQMYIPFSYDGAALQSGYAPGTKNETHLQKNTPFFAQTDLDGCNVESSVARILAYRLSGTVQFHMFRGVLCPASFYKQVVDALASHTDIKFLTPINNAYLARVYLGGNNGHRISYTDDSILRNFPSGHQSVYSNFTVTIRNDGWSVIDQIVLKIHIDGELVIQFACNDIPLGQSNTCQGDFKVPNKAGSYQMVYQIYQGITPFSEFGNIPWTTSIIVA